MKPMAARFLDHLTRRVLVCDGAMGTMIHRCNCDLHRDYLDKENCCEVLNLTRPDVIQGIHEQYLAAGADIVETNTFSGSGLVLAEFDLADKTHEIAKRAAEIARAACDRHSTSDKPRFVAGSMGPGTKLLTLGHTTWEQMLEAYYQEALGLIDGGADFLLTETSQDMLQVKCAINACLKALEERGRSLDQVPILCSVTIETMGTMLLGTEIAAAAEALRPYPITSLGLNCATGPREMTEHIAWLGKHWARNVSCMPNAGLPVLLDGKPDYPLKPGPFVEAMLRFVEQDGVNLVGGCCGTTPEHIAQLVKAVGSRSPAKKEKSPPRAGCSSLYSVAEFRQDTSFLVVGERTNTNGSKQFRTLLGQEDWDGLVSMGKALVRDGSHVLDVCVDYVGREGARDMREAVTRFARQVTVPLMIDSTQVDVLEAGLKHAPGKCIINSMNLEDGEEKLAHICGLARTYGAAVIAGTIDDDPTEAMAKTAQRKLQIAQRIFDLATEKYGLAAGDILFDPLVLPVTTGVEADRRLALETVEGIRLISKHLPECGTCVGLSNVSFGLKPAARVVLNSVFLHECLEAGLTGAIVHASKILPRKDIEESQWNAALDLIYDKRRAPGTIGADDAGFDPLTAFISLFPDEGEAASAGKKKATLADLPLEERLRRHIIDGEMRGLTDGLNEAMKKYKPLEIVNDHLLDGMKVVGEMFGAGEMQLPFVLQSAEVMKKAVAHLEPHMEKVEGSRRATMVLATVQGDVHDIGKNLVDIILSNNGYRVVNLGIKQPLSNILRAAEEHQADAIGLSGLLVKSVGVMRDNLQEMHTQKLEVPVILGGAALTRQYAEEDLRGVYGHTYYGRDAFEGLRFMDHLASRRLGAIDEEIAGRIGQRAKAAEEFPAVAAIADRNRRAAAASTGVQTGTAVQAATATRKAVARRSSIKPAPDIPSPPFWGTRVIESGIDLDRVYAFVNKVALFRGQWQFKKGAMSDEEFAEQTTGEVAAIFERLKEQCKREAILRPRVVYGYFPCANEGDDLVIYDPIDPVGGAEVERFTFPRQDGRQHLCISDFFLPVDSSRRDVIAMHCVTMGEEVSKRARRLFEEDKYTEYLYLHGMGVECAEALAELWHKRIRQELGIDGEDSPRVHELFTQKYRGSRYSFGYPACPDMSDQEKLFRLLRPERIGCVLTENWQIDPEQSTSAIVVHHPAAKYFNV